MGPWHCLGSRGHAALAAALFASLLLALSGAVRAQGTERERIVAERQAIGAHYTQLEQACHDRFAVTACVEDVQARRREALAPLRERELRLDEADRLQRAAQRRAAVLAKQQAALSNAAAPAAPAPAPLALRLREAPLPAASSLAAGPARAAGLAETSAARASEAATRVQAAQQRRAAAQATHDRVARRKAEREKSGRRSAPLPVPAASAAAR